MGHKTSNRQAAFRVQSAIDDATGIWRARADHRRVAIRHGEDLQRRGERTLLDRLVAHGAALLEELRTAGATIGMRK